MHWGFELDPTTFFVLRLYPALCPSKMEAQAQTNKDRSLRNLRYVIATWQNDATRLLLSTWSMRASRCERQAIRDELSHEEELANQV